MAKKKNEQYSDDDQDYGDEPNFDDPEGFVDDVTDEGKLYYRRNACCQHSMADMTHNLNLINYFAGLLMHFTFVTNVRTEIF